ncbi:hypothetical protein, partial [Bergeriella denitrificans]|uniref:hypothetical protein n=1 Tax=Bergeriella denitrificans TaxID=494 RepID=UPI0014700237
YINLIKDPNIKNIYTKSKYYWDTLDQTIDLEQLRLYSWQFHDEHFKINLDSIDEIILRMIIATTYLDDNKEDFEQAIEFIELLVLRAEELGYK